VYKRYRHPRDIGGTYILVCPTLMITPLWFFASYIDNEHIGQAARSKKWRACNSFPDRLFIYLL